MVAEFVETVSTLPRYHATKLPTREQHWQWQMRVRVAGLYRKASKNQSPDEMLNGIDWLRGEDGGVGKGGLVENTLPVVTASAA